jgi:hypothetical protein
MKEQLRRVRDAALLFRRALSDAATSEFLEIMPQDLIEYGGGIDHKLQDLATRTERAMASFGTLDERREVEGGSCKSSDARCFSPKAVLRGSDRRNVGVFPS